MSSSGERNDPGVKCAAQILYSCDIDSRAGTAVAGIRINAAAAAVIYIYTLMYYIL